MKLAIVTSCINGTVNSFIAAGLLENAAVQLGYDATIEAHSTLITTQYQPLTTSTIEQADLIILACSRMVDSHPFIGKKVYHSDVEHCLVDAKSYIEQAITHAQLLTSPITNWPIATMPLVNKTNALKIIGITACPTGVAHTFMAAEALEIEGKRLGHQIKIETQGSVGAKNQLTAQEIEQADLVIIATDIDVNLDRFSGKRLYKTNTGLALKKTTQEIDNAITQATIYTVKNATSTNKSNTQEDKGIYKHLMTGVSYMLPLVVAGGLCIALSFIFGIKAFEVKGTLAAALMTIGGASAFALMVPVLSGFIAYSIADRPGLAPGLIGGMIASSIGAGFLGGIIAGFLAGYAAKLCVDYIKLPTSMEALKPILIVPLLASLITGLIMIYIIGTPIAMLMSWLTDFLKNMGTANAVLLGALLGAMMCFDLGGPINKVAYVFGTGLLASHTYAPMAAIMAAGMVPPLGMAVATFIAGKKFQKSEREAGKAAFILGLCFISEGAIPFAAKDPMRVIPSCMAGGIVAGMLSMLFGAQLMAPHGGLFVLFIPNAITPPFLYVIAIAAGTMVTGLGYAFLKRADI